MSSYTIFIRYKGLERAVLNAAYNTDGSFQITDLVTKGVKNPEFLIVTFNLPARDGRSRKILKADKAKYYVNNRVAINHHVSGRIHIKGEKPETVIQGFDVVTGRPKGIGLDDGFDLQNETNDGYQFLGARFWGLNLIQPYESKTSQRVVFSDEEINYQTMGDVGKSVAFTVLFFHIPIKLLSSDDLEKGSVYYRLERFKKPLFLKLLVNKHNHGFVVGVSCLKSRCDSKGKLGFTMSAGATKIDEKTDTCKNIAIIYPSNRDVKNEDYISLNFEDFKKED